MKVDLKTKKAKVIHEKRNKKTRRNKSMVKTKIIKELKCEFCGKGLRQEVNTWVVGGKEICIKRIPERCDCKQAKEYWKEQDEFERIKLLTKLEIERKKNIERLYTLSGMSSRLRNYNFENYKVCNENKTAYFKAKKYVADLLAGKKSNSLFITGNIGTGKTHLAASIANELIKNGQPVIFGTLINLLTEVKDSYSIDGEYESKIINKYSKIGLLIIDDLGKERPSEWTLEKLFTIINNRYENNLPVIITTNYNREKLRERLACNKNYEIADSIISRLYEMCKGINITGKDKRKELV